MAGRNVGVAMDFSPCSKHALKWALHNIIREGDHLILINVQGHVEYEHGETQLWEATGSPIIPLADFADPYTAKKYEVKADQETLDLLEFAAKQKGILVGVKIYWGDAREKICAAVENIPLDCLVMGSRGLGKIKRAILGSVSNYVVRDAPCPVTVVKGPEQHT